MVRQGSGQVEACSAEDPQIGAPRVSCRKNLSGNPRRTSVPVPGGGFRIGSDAFGGVLAWGAGKLGWATNGRSMGLA
jgi:hypothetical protein